MYYNSPCYYLRQQGMTGMNMNQMNPMQGMPQAAPGQQPFGQMPTMPMQPMMPTNQMETMDQNVGATLGGAMGVPMGGATPIPPTGGGMGMPFGTTTGVMPTNIASVPLAPSAAGQPVMDVQFTQGYLKTQIGRRVKVEFLLGTNTIEDRDGILVDVGISYIIINETDTDDLLLCDIYSIKFVRFYF
jgi:hypothetical protein